MARKIGAADVLHAPGLYERVRERELRTALTPDPRAFLVGDPVQRRRTEETAPAYNPSALGQVAALLAREPVRVPRWALSGRMAPETHDWAPYADRRVRWFTLTPDDVLTPV